MLICFQGYSLAHNISQSFYEYLGSHPERSKRFAGAMQAFGEGPYISPDFLVDNFPWPVLGSGTVVDLGGSNGSVSMAVSKAYPALRFVVQDRPPVIEAALEGSLPADLVGKLNSCPTTSSLSSMWRQTYS